MRLSTATGQALADPDLTVEVTPTEPALVARPSGLRSDCDGRPTPANGKHPFA